MANGKKTSGRRSSKYEAPKQRRITKQQIENATYKDVKLLEKFVSDRGKIRSSLITGITKQEQAKVARLIKVARELALLPYVTTSSYKQSYNRRWNSFSTLMSVVLGPDTKFETTLEVIPETK